MSLIPSVLTLLIAAQTAPASSPAPDRILINATVHTMDDSRPKAEAVAITSGRITAVGSTKDLFATKGPRTQVLDLSGATVIPATVR